MHFINFSEISRSTKWSYKHRCVLLPAAFDLRAYLARSSKETDELEPNFHERVEVRDKRRLVSVRVVVTNTKCFSAYIFRWKLRNSLQQSII